MKVLIPESVPVSVSAEAVPSTVTPPPEIAESVPEGTENVAVIVPLPASASEKLMPVSALA